MADISSWHVSVAAEAVTAALFARCGYDVSVQYGANQPEYDLIVADGDRLLKVSVKGSKDGGWGLCQSHLTPKKADYHDAIARWASRHSAGTIFALVQFKGASPIENASSLPREAERGRTASGIGLTDLMKSMIDTTKSFVAPSTARYIKFPFRKPPDRKELCSLQHLSYLER